MPILGGVNSKNLVYNSFNVDEELTKVNPIDALQSGKIKKSDIGKTVYLSNTATTCQEWRIADVNHENTNSVDLIIKYTDDPSTRYNIYGGDGYFYNSKYDRSINQIRTGFTNPVKAAMAYMDFTEDKDIYGRGHSAISKIKAPSAAELGWYSCTDIGNAINSHGSYKISQEGEMYPLFGKTSLSSSKTANPLAIVKTVSGYAYNYLTRTHTVSDQEGVVIQGYCEVTNNGYLINSPNAANESYYSSGLCIVRFGTSQSDKDFSKLDNIALFTTNKLSKNDVGKIVYIKNDYVPHNEWIIADINHDSTSGTVDLISRYILGYNYENGKSINFTEDGLPSYSVSNCRTWFNNNFYNAFSDSIKQIMQKLDNDGSTDYIRMPSATEFGLNSDGITNVKSSGTVYPIFGNTSSQSKNSLAIGRIPNISDQYSRSTASDCFTRSILTSGQLTCINKEGNLVVSVSEYFNKYGFVSRNVYRPVIRLKLL